MALPFEDKEKEGGGEEADSHLHEPPLKRLCLAVLVSLAVGLAPWSPQGMWAVCLGWEVCCCLGWKAQHVALNGLAPFGACFLL